MAVKRANSMPFRHFFLLLIIFMLSGCLGLGGRDRDGYAPPKMPVMTQTMGTISLSGSGAGSTISTSGQTANAPASGPAGELSIGPQLEALTSEIRSLRGRFEAMEPAITRLVRVEQDMTVLIREMELLANEPVPFVSPENLFAPAIKVPVAPLAAQPLISQAVPPSARQGDAGSSAPGISQVGQEMPTLSLGLSGSSRDAAADRSAAAAQMPSSEGAATEPLHLGRQADPAIALAPAFAPDMAPAPALAPTAQPYPFSAPRAAAEDERMAALPQKLPPDLSCDSFGVHVGSYLLDESIVAARVAVRRRHASTLENLYFTTADIDLRDGRGVFHRLIAGPIADYEQATALCDAIESRGDYCVVTFFDPPNCNSGFN